MSAPSRTHLIIRPYVADDEEEVLSLLRIALGNGPAGQRPVEFYRWKHLENPFGRSYLLVGEAAGQIIGFRAFLRWRFRQGRDRVAAVRAVDTATHPDHQGRGVFQQLTLRAIEDLRHESDLVFNTPNEKSLPGYLKMGWRPVGTIRVSVRIRRPGSLVRALKPKSDMAPRPRIDALPASEVLQDLDAVDRLLEDENDADERLRSERTAEFLRWRYGRAPLLDYRAVVSSSPDGIEGMVLFRVRPRRGIWEATVTEVIVPPGDVKGARRLLQQVIRSSGVDVLTGRFPSASTAARALRRAGFVRAPRGITLVVKPLRPIGIDPERPGSWALGLGDLEVF